MLMRGGPFYFWGRGGGEEAGLRDKKSCTNLKQGKSHARLVLYHGPFFEWKKFSVGENISCSDQISLLPPPSEMK